MMSVELGIICGVVLVGAILCWRLLTCLQYVTGASLRSNDRREKNLTDTIERLVEKERIKASLDLAQVHARERIESVRANTQMEAKAQEKVKPTQRPLSEVSKVHPGDVMDMSKLR